MRTPLSLLLTVLVIALALVAGCNPPSNPTCSTTYIGQAVINEVSKVQANATNSNSLDDANDFVEIKILNTSLTTSTLNNWNVLICEKGTSSCYGGALSDATVTTATDGSGARYYVIKSLANVGRYINFAVGTEIALSDQNNYAIDYLSIGGYADHKPTACTFQYGTTASSTTTTRRIRRNADGTGNWETVNANDQPATEGLNNTAMPPLVAEWRMDEASWNGTNNEVVATTGSLHGTSKNSTTTKNATPAKSTNPGTCRYGDFDSSKNNYVAVTSGSALDFPTAMTFAGWIYPRTVGSGTTARGTIMSRGIMSSASSSDFVYALRLNTANDLIFYQCTTLGSTCTAYNTITASLASGLLNKWTHVAVSFHSGYQKVYLNGVEVASAGNIGTMLSNSRPLFFGATPNSATSPNSYFNPLDGMLDELRFYNGALTQSQVQSVMNETHLCGPVVIDHFAITAPSAAVTCDAVTVTVAPHSVDHQAPTSYTGTASLGATISGSASGSWELITGGGIFNTAGTGAATYKFASGEGAATFRYKNTNAGVVSFTASDGTVSASENNTVTFSAAGFVFLVDGTSVGAGGSLPTQIAAKDSNAGWNNRTLSVRAVITNTTTGACMSRLPAGQQSIEFAYSCSSPNSCSGTPTFTIAGNNSAAISNASATTWQSVNLQFDGNATAPFVMNYNDAGQVQLNVRKTLTSDSLGPAATLTGNALANVRPFGIRFESISGNRGADETGVSNNSNVVDSNGANLPEKFVAAGSPFAMSLTAFAYASNQDANSDGIPDTGVSIASNAKTNNFAATASLSVSAFTPAGGRAGDLGTPSPNFSAGAVSLSNQTYSEVGSMTMKAEIKSYLSVPAAELAGLTATSAKVGRFYPYDFYLSNVTLPPPQSCTAFTYMSQPLTAQFSLVARSASGATTQNYSAALGYAKLATPAYAAKNNNEANSWNRVTANAGVWSSGAYTLSPVSPATYAGPISFDRLSAPDGPYPSVQLGMIVSDKDGAKLAGLDMLPTTAGACTAATCTAQSLNASPIPYRYGRLVVRSTTGSDQATAVAMPVALEYYNGTQFVRNDSDSCTAYGSGSAQLNDVDFSGALASYYVDSNEATAGHWSLPSSTTVNAGLFRDSPNGLRIMPVAGRTGELAVTMTAPAWLQYNWGNDNCGPNDANPCGKLILGQARGNDRVIYWRELH